MVSIILQRVILSAEWWSEIANKSIGSILARCITVTENETKHNDFFQPEKFLPKTDFSVLIEGRGISFSFDFGSHLVCHLEANKS